MVRVPCRTVLWRILSFAVDLKSALYAAFSQFGKILQVTSAKTYKLRGQAWVIFEERKAAQSAINYLNGFTFYDKPLVRSYFSIFMLFHKFLVVFVLRTQCI